MRALRFVVVLSLVICSVQPASAVTQSLELRTISGFTGSKFALTSKQQSTIRGFAQIQAVEQITCTGFTKTKPNATDRKVALYRAKSVCRSVASVQPMAQSIKTTVSVGQPKQVGTVRVAFTISEPDEVIALPVPNSPFDKPFPTEFTKKQLMSAAVTALKDYVDAQTRSTTIELVYQDSVPMSERAWMDSMVQFLQKSFPLDDSAKRPLIVIGSSDEFIAAEATRRGLLINPPGFCGRITTFESYCASLGWAGLNYKDSIEKKNPISDSGKRSVLAHEYFHVWHKSIDGSTGPNNKDPRSPEGIPLWFMEGNANFFGFALTDLARHTTYAEGRASQVDEYMRSVADPLSAHISWDKNPYGIGQASAEYLVASVGVPRVLEVYRKIGKGVLFAEAFESSIGISVSDYYLKFEAARKSMLD